MRLKLYRAATLAQAMARVRTELGVEALILGSRRVADGVELTAALEPADPAPRLPSVAGQAMLGFHAIPAALAQQLGGAPLAGALATALSFAPLDLTPGGPPLLFAGPPGAGKTLTVVRLATRLVMQGTAPLVITADGRRAGASEQLAALTRLLGLDLAIATDAVAMSRGVARRREGTPVLLDLPGSDPFAPQEREDLATLAAALSAMIVVVLPAGLDPAEAADLAAAYREAGARLLVATRIDCARRLGGVLAAAAGLGFAEAGIGPGAADGLVPATPDLLATWIARKSHDAPEADRTA